MLETARLGDQRGGMESIVNIPPGFTLQPQSQTVLAGRECDLHRGGEWHSAVELSVAKERGEHFGGDQTSYSLVNVGLANAGKLYGRRF